MCLGALLPLKLVRDPYVKKALQQRLGGLPTENQVHAGPQEIVKDMREEVTRELELQKRQGTRFTLSGDTWKPKMRRRCHYLAVYVDYVGPA